MTDHSQDGETDIDQAHVEHRRATLRKIRAVREEVTTQVGVTEQSLRNVRLLLQRVDILEQEHEGVVSELEELELENSRLRHENARLRLEIASKPRAAQ